METQSTLSKENAQRQLDRRFFFTELANALTWGMSVGVSIYYTVRASQDGPIAGTRIWDQNFKYQTGFTMDPHMVITYWAMMHMAQLAVILMNIISRPDNANYFAISNHICTNNLLHVVFLVLFVRSAFGWAEGVLLLNFFNLSVFYFQQHNTLPHLTHILALCGPLAWSFVAIFWNWAIAVSANIGYNSIVEGFGLFFLWGILGYGMICLLIFQDLAMAFLPAYLSVSIAVAQHFLQHSNRLGFPPIIVASLLVAMIIGIIGHYTWTTSWVIYRKREGKSVETSCKRLEESC